MASFFFFFFFFFFSSESFSRFNFLGGVEASESDFSDSEFDFKGVRFGIVLLGWGLGLLRGDFGLLRGDLSFAGGERSFRCRECIFICVEFGSCFEAIKRCFGERFFSGENERFLAGGDGDARFRGGELYGDRLGEDCLLIGDGDLLRLGGDRLLGELNGDRLLLGGERNLGEYGDRRLL